MCFSLSGVVSGAIDVSAKLANTTLTSLSSGATAVPGTANDIAIGVVHYDPGTATLTDTWGTRILDLHDTGVSPQRGLEAAYLVVSGTPATTATWTTDVAVTAECFVALYPAAAALPQQIRPDADTDASTWTTTPLWSKIDEVTAGGDVITATAA